ncbi:MAG: hypothetical protein AB7L91_04315 [Dehalococcoidia bacterium]
MTTSRPRSMAARIAVLVLVAALGLAALWTPAPASAEGTVDQENLTSAAASEPLPSLLYDQYFGQTFRPGRWGYLDQIKVGMVVPSQLTLTMYVRELKNEGDGSFSKEILAQASATVDPGGSCDQQSLSLVTFEFAQPAVVRPDRDYVLHVDIGSYDSQACVGGPYPSGTFVLVFDDGPVDGPTDGTPGPGTDGIVIFVVSGGPGEDLVFQTFVDTGAYIDDQFALLRQQIDGLSPLPKLLLKRFLPWTIHSPFACLGLGATSLTQARLEQWYPTALDEVAETLANLSGALNCGPWPPTWL